MDIGHILELSRQDDLAQTALDTAIEQIARLEEGHEKQEAFYRQNCIQCGEDGKGELITRLLAVARAAYIYDYCMDEDIERKERLLLIMRAALADVEALL